MEKNKKLPHGWIETKLNNLCELIGGGTPSRNNLDYFGGNIIWLTPTEISKNTITRIGDSKEKITELGLKKSSARIIPKESVLLTSRASIGYVAIADDNVTTNQGFASFICSNAIFNYYLAYWLWGNKKNIESEATGTTFKEISKSKLREMIIFLPPLNEQKRIVEKIEELFSLINSTKHVLEKTKILLKQYIQSFLKSTFEGNLTEKWRNENECDVEFELEILRKSNGEKLKNDSKSLLEFHENMLNLHKIPKQWRWIRLGFLSKLITKGASPKWQGIDYVDNGILFITSENVGFGNILLNKPKYLEKKINEIQKRSILQKGDILTNIVGASIGRTAIYDLDDIANINQAVSLIRLYDQVNRKYVQHILNSPLVLNYMNLEKVDVARANLSLQNVADFPIPLSSIKEQEQIVFILEHSFSLIKNTENITNSMLKQLDAIKSSILKQAFEGKLVPQDPNDEPASELLKRIKLHN